MTIHTCCRTQTAGFLAHRAPRVLAAFLLLLLLPAVGYGAVLTNDLVLWLRADAGVTADSGGYVSAWADQSGANHHAAQGNPGQRAQLVAGVLRGKPVIRFDGTDDYFDLAGQVLTSDRFSIFAVVNDFPSGANYHRREIFSNWTPATGPQSVFFGTVMGNPVRARLTDDLGGPDGVGMIGNPGVHFIFTGISGGTDASIYQFDTLLAAKGSPLAPRTLNTPYAIGNQGQGNQITEYWSGDIAEVLVYNRELTQSEREQNWAYLRDKYFSGTTECVSSPPTLAGIQACINSASPGGIVRVGAGTVTLPSGQSITIPDDKLNIRLVGAGVGQTIINGVSGGGVLVSVGSGYASSGATVIEGFSFLSDGAAPSGRGIRIGSNGNSASDPAIIRNNYFGRLETAIAVRTYEAHSDWKIGDGNVFEDCQSDIFIRRMNRLTISGNTFRRYGEAIWFDPNWPSTNVEIVGNTLEGGTVYPAPWGYIGITLNGLPIPSGEPKNWTIRDNRISGGTIGIFLEPLPSSPPPNFDGVSIRGNCLYDNTHLAAELLPVTDIWNDTGVFFDARNNYGGTSVMPPQFAGPGNTAPWLKDLSYTGATSFTPLDSIVLSAKVQNTDGTNTGPVRNVLVRFYLVIDGQEVFQGSGITDVTGIATFSLPAPYSEWTRTVIARAAGGCLEATGTITVKKIASTTTYAGQTYDADMVPGSTVSATVASADPNVPSCGALATSQYVTFEVTPLSGGAPVTVGPLGFDNVGSPVLHTSASLDLAPGVYSVTVSYRGNPRCLPSADSAVLVVAGPGDSANGGGWYKVAGFTPPRANFGFTVQKVMQGGRTAGYRGQLLWMNTNKWRLRGVVDTDAAAYGTFPCPSWTGYTGVTDNPVCAAFRGSGLLEAWDPTGMQWLPATAYGNNGAVTFTATAYDGGTASICKKRACTNGDVADYFGIQIDPVPGTVLPESPPLLLMGGSIKAQ